MSKNPMTASVVGTVSALVAFTAHEMWIRPWAARWGATDEELRRRWPGDEFVPNAVQTVTHGITITAPASSVWPWILQIGQDRAGYYSYSWLENLFGAEIHNILRIVPEFQTRSVGDDVWMAPKHKYRGQARMVVVLSGLGPCNGLRFARNGWNLHGPTGRGHVGVHCRTSKCDNDAHDTSRTQWPQAELQCSLLESRLLGAGALHHGTKDDDDNQSRGRTAAQRKVGFNPTTSAF